MVFTVQLDEHEKAILRYLAERFDSGDRQTAPERWPGYAELGRDRINDIGHRFHNHQWLDVQADINGNIGRATIYPRVLVDVHAMDNPPRKDYWAWLTAWFRSRWWSLPLFILFVTLPLLVKWVEMIQSILKWLGISAE